MGYPYRPTPYFFLSSLFPTLFRRRLTLPKLSLSNISSGFRSSNKLNQNFAAISAQLDNTISRDGTAPNQMMAPLDMNSSRIINVGAPQNLTDAVRLVDVTGPDSIVITSVPYLDTAYGGNGGGVINNVTALTNAAANSPDKIRVKAGNYLLNSDVSLGDRVLELYQGASFTGSGRALPGNQAFTNSERFGTSTRNTSISAYDIYGSIFPNVSYYDVVQAVARLAPGSAFGSHISAIAGYIQVDAPITGIGNNAVALFGGGRISVNNGIGWGINTLLQDNNTRTTHTGTGRYMLGAELDFNVMGTATQVVGISVGGNSLAQPVTANAYLVNTLSAELGYKWGCGLFSLDGCASIGIALGAMEASGTNINSQPMIFSYFNLAGTKTSYTLRAAGTQFFEILGGDVSVQNGNLLLASNRGLAIGGNIVVAARQTGWTVATGTPYVGPWNADTQVPNTGNWAADQAGTRSVVETISRRLLALEAAVRYHGLIGLT